MSGFSGCFNFEFKPNQIAKAVLGFVVASFASLPRVIRAVDPAPTANDESPSNIYIIIGACTGAIALGCMFAIVCHQCCKNRAQQRAAQQQEMVVAGAPETALAISLLDAAAKREAQNAVWIENRAATHPF